MTILIAENGLGLSGRPASVLWMIVHNIGVQLIGKGV